MKLTVFGNDPLLNYELHILFRPVQRFHIETHLQTVRKQKQNKVCASAFSLLVSGLGCNGKATEQESYISVNVDEFEKVGH